MDDDIYYEAFGEISGKTPLEAFYNRMLPLLKNYGLTAGFPADKPSLAYDGMMEIKFDVWIGEPPAAMHYRKWQESPYGMGGFELTLESETLVHVATGEKLHVKIFITDYISGLNGANGYFWLTIKFSGAASEVERFKNAVAPVLSEYDFCSRKVKTAAFAVEAANETTNVGKDGADNLETPASPFDELARKINVPNPPKEDLNRLFGAVFDLREWQFISRGELPDVRPYTASNAAIADNQPMIRAFTDSTRLIRFAKENNLARADGSCNSLTIPTANIIEYLENFIADGAYGVWFNSDSESEGFFIPIKQLRPIKEHLAKLNQPPRPNPEGEIDSNSNTNKVSAVVFETPVAPLLEDYRETGEIDDKTPLEPFYEAMLPVLADYGFAEKFPEGRISTLSGGYTGYEYDVLIGAPPQPAFRYTNMMPGGYSTFCDEQRSLESVGLSHFATGEEIFIRLDIRNPYSGGKLRLTLEISGAQAEVQKFKIAFAPVLTRYNFKSHNAEANISEPKPQFVTLLFNVIHGFWGENGFSDPVVTNYFCLVPENWTKDGKITKEFAEKFFLKIFGASFDGSYAENMARNVAAYNSTVLDQRLAEKTNWSEMETDARNRCQFYVASELGEINAVYAKDFRK